MRTLFIILTLSFFALNSGQAQILSEAHQQKLEQIKDPAKRQKLYKKYLRRDSRKFHKQLKDTIDYQVKNALKDSLEKLDSDIALPKIKLDSALLEKGEQKVKRIAKDSLDQYVEVPDIKLDSTLSDQVKSAIKQKAEYETGTSIPKLDSAAMESKLNSEAKSGIEKEMGTPLPDITMDSTTLQQVEDEAVRRAESALKDQKGFEDLGAMEDSELGKLEGYKDKLANAQEELRQATARQALKQKMTSQAKEFITAHADKIQQVQSKMGELKKKYSYVPNSNDLSTAKKRSSLKDESLWKRLVIGGNFSISQTNPVTIDLSPVLGYKINKLFKVGATGAYRAKFGADHTGIYSNNDETYGYGLFANHMVFKNFFGQLEAERLRTTTGTREQPERSWKQTFLIGVGRKFKVSKWLEMQALVMFNLWHDNQTSPYSSPVIFKTGFRVSK